MQIQIINFIEAQRNKLWVLPLAVIALFVCVGFTALRLDEWYYQNHNNHWPMWLFQGDVIAAQAIITTIATASASIVSLVISMTMVVFSIASSQYGPMMLRNFVIDIKIQMIVGGLIGLFTYCLMTLRVMNHTENNLYVPEMTITIGMLISVLGLLALIYILHHVASSLRIETLVSNICIELKQTLTRRFPEKSGASNQAFNAEPLATVECPFTQEVNTSGDNAHCYPWQVMSQASGYIQTIDEEGLLAFCEANGWQASCWVRAGHFVVKGQLLFTIQPLSTSSYDSSQSQSQDLIHSFVRHITIGTYRSPAHDPEFAIDQLVEIAILALSPGVNRTYTAIMCIDQLVEALCWVVNQRVFPSRVRVNASGKPVLWLYPLHFSHLLEAAFNKIRQNAYNNEAIAIHLLKALNTLACQCTLPHQMMAIRSQADALAEKINQVHHFAQHDFNAFEGAYKQLIERCTSLSQISKRS